MALSCSPVNIDGTSMVLAAGSGGAAVEDGAQAAMTGDIGAGIAASGTAPQEWTSCYGRLLTTLTSPERCPAVSRLVVGGVFDTAGGPDDEFISAWIGSGTGARHWCGPAAESRLRS
jgi:hypothetical protein